jgi:hypothetical protein
MRHLLLACALFFTTVNVAFSAVPEELPKTPSAITIGSEVPSIRTAAERTAKGVIYAAALIILAASLIKRFRKTEGAANPFHLLGRRAFGRSALLLVEVEGRKLVLSQSPEGLSLVSSLEPDFSDFDEALSRPALVGNERLP